MSHNSITRMYGVNRLYYLKQVDLSYNNIPAIEGLRELVSEMLNFLRNAKFSSVSRFNFSGFALLGITSSRWTT